MNIIDRDIDFYTGCMENAKNDLIKAFPEEEEAKKEIYDTYSKIVLTMNYLKHLIEKK